MGTVFKPTLTKPATAGAETFVRKGERFARWKDRKGKTRTAPLTVGKDGSERIVIESPCYVAKYRDGAGVVQRRGDRLPRRNRRPASAGGPGAPKAELVRARRDDRGRSRRRGPPGRATRRAPRRLRRTPPGEGSDEDSPGGHRPLPAPARRRLRFRDARRPAPRSPGALACPARTPEGMSARTRNAYRNALASFCNWCVETNRLAVNPFDAVPKANEKADPRRQRRAMTEPELVKLLAVARERPLLEALTVRKGPRKGERYADVRPEVRERLELLGGNGR